MNSNIILIGMPGVGKSTVGVLVAKNTSRNFIDSDLLIQIKTGASLQETVNLYGQEILRQIEEDVLLELCVENCVVATGGSAVYSQKAMKALKKNGIIIFLDLNLGELKKRIHNFTTRGIAKRPDQTLEDLLDERFQLYSKYSDITIKCDGLSQEEVCQKIITAISTKISTKSEY